MGKIRPKTCEGRELTKDQLDGGPFRGFMNEAGWTHSKGSSGELESDGKIVGASPTQGTDHSCMVPAHDKPTAAQPGVRVPGHVRQLNAPPAASGVAAKAQARGTAWPKPSDGSANESTRCSGHGYLHDGRCTCTEDHTGEMCEMAPVYRLVGCGEAKRCGVYRRVPQRACGGTAVYKQELPRGGPPGAAPPPSDANILFWFPPRWYVGPNARLRDCGRKSAGGPHPSQVQREGLLLESGVSPGGTMHPPDHSSFNHTWR